MQPRPQGAFPWLWTTSSPGRCNRWSFFRVFYRNLALLHLRVLFLACIVLLQNKHTTLDENGENLINALPRISAHSQGPNILISA